MRWSAASATGSATYIVSALFLGVFFAMYSGTLDSVVYDTVLEETGDGAGFERRIGRVRLVEGVSFAASALAGGVIAGATSPRLTYFLTVPCAGLAVVALTRFREPRLHRVEDRVPLGEHVRLTLRAITGRAHVLPIVAAGAVAGVVLQTIFEFGPVWLVTLAVPAFVFGPYWAGLTGTLALGGAFAGRLPLDRPGVVVAVTMVLVSATVTLGLSTSFALVAIAQIVCALLLVVVGIHVSQRLHDAVASTVRAGVASGVSTLTWLAFLPVALVFGWIANEHGVHLAAWLLTGLVLAAGASLFRLTMHASPSAGGLACDEVVELASGLVDGDLTPAEQDRVEEHRSRCPGCSRYLDQVRELRRLLGSLRP